METLDVVQRVEHAFAQHGLDIQIKHFDKSTGTAFQAAGAIGCELGAIVKSLCFIIDEQPILVLVAGDRRVDAKALRHIFNVSKRKVRIADQETVRRVTGFTVGGVAPVGHFEPLKTLIDSSLARFDQVYAAAGSAHTIFGISYQTLIEITGGECHELSMP